MLTERIVLHGLAHSGDAVGRRPNGQVVFVPHGVPGDQAEICLESQNKGYARGRIAQLMLPSQHRVLPPCPLSQGRCGGCPWMQADLFTQRAAKQAHVEQALRRFATTVQPLLQPTPNLGYRIRARFVCNQGVLGFRATASHRTQAISHCPVLHPALEAILCPLARLLEPWIGEEGTLAGLVDASDQVQVSIHMGLQGDKKQILLHLQDFYHQGRIHSAWCDGVCLGAPTVNLDKTGKPLWATAEGFAQASMAGHTVLPQCVVAAVPKPSSVLLELHAGSGNFTRFLAEAGHQVTAVEADRAAATRLRQALPHVSVIQATALAFLRTSVSQQSYFSGIVLDPPRTGALEEVRWIAQLQPLWIVYVSCDPMTLARDLHFLAKDYQLDWVQPLDLMPHTTHVEVVCRLTRRTKTV